MSVVILTVFGHQTMALQAPAKSLVVMEGGREDYRYDSDTEKVFRQESSFAYLFGVKEPGFYGVIDIHTGHTILYMPRLPEEYAVWMGKIQPPSHFQVSRWGVSDFQV